MHVELSVNIIAYVVYLFSYLLIITPLPKEVMFLVALVCLFVVCGHYSKKL